MSHIAKITKDSNQLINILEKYTEGLTAADYWWLSCNPGITIEYIIKNPSRYWNWKNISKNAAITEYIIDNNPELPWDYQMVAANPNITLEWAESRIDIPWDYTWFADNKNITMAFIKKHPSNKWIEMAGTVSRNISLEEIDAYPDFPWDYNNICLYNRVTLEWIDTHAHLPINYYYIKTTYTVEWISLNYYKKIDYYKAAKYIDDPIRYIENFISNCTGLIHYTDHASMMINYISENENITLDMLDYFRGTNYDWAYHAISRNPHLTIEWVKKYKNSAWCWRTLTSHKNITMDDIKQNPEFPWQIDYINNNPNIRAEHLGRYLKWHMLSTNKLSYTADNIVVKKKIETYETLSSYIIKDILYIVVDYVW